MAIQNVAMNAYTQAMKTGRELAEKNKTAVLDKMPGQEEGNASFAETIGNSLHKVNEMQAEKAAAITSFASGETMNVHELMITLQKAGLAVKMTSAVRGKVMEAYKTIMHMSF
jgi:flagellar hook-basal body complex protein FliE